MFSNRIYESTSAEMVWNINPVFNMYNLWILVVVRADLGTVCITILLLACFSECIPRCVTLRTFQICYGESFLRMVQLHLVPWQPVDAPARGRSPHLPQHLRTWPWLVTRTRTDETWSKCKTKTIASDTDYIRLHIC